MPPEKDRLAKLFEKYAAVIRTGTENEALQLRKKIREERERLDKK